MTARTMHINDITKTPTDAIDSTEFPRSLSAPKLEFIAALNFGTVCLKLVKDIQLTYAE